MTKDDDIHRDVPDESSEETEAHSRKLDFGETVPVDSSAPQSRASHRIPPKIGPYAIVREIGRGGMGVVYEGEQPGLGRRVAVKVIRGTAAFDDISVRLFKREAKSLARLKHPGIASIYDFGITDLGEHYFAMELIEGELLGRHVGSAAVSDERQIRKRLQLFKKICEAVEYAHQRGIVHRDLKPSNIEVTEETAGDEIPEIKVLDFGLARTMDEDLGGTTALSEEGAIRGTLTYMSPEQASGDPDAIDVRTDVYSLGIILFEMIAGSLPYDVSNKSLLDALRVIQEVEPSRIRSIPGCRFVDSDLETMIGKAIEKDPDRRYRSAGAFAEDVERYLTSQPLLARPPSTAYQLKKLVARNRVPATFAGVLLITLIVTSIALSMLYSESESNLERALSAEGEANQVTDFLIGLFRVSDPGEARGNDIRAREILDKGVARIKTELVDQPEVRTRIMQTMGVVYDGLGLYGEARGLLEEAIEGHEAIATGLDERLPLLKSDLATVYENEARYEEAEAEYQMALAMREELHGPDHPDVAVALSDLGSLYSTLGRLEKADELLSRSLAIVEALDSERAGLLVACLNNLAELRTQQGRVDDAESLLLRSLRIREESTAPDHPSIALAKSNLAIIFRDQNRLEEAERFLGEALEIWEKVLGESHPDVALAQMNLGSVLRQKGDLGRAKSMFEQAISTRREVLGEESAPVAEGYYNLGLVARDLGELPEAEKAARQARGAWASALGAEHPLTSMATDLVGEICMLRGKYDEAESVLLEALRACKATLGGDHPLVALPMNNLGRLSTRVGHFREAEVWLLDALHLRESALPEGHYRIAESLDACAELYAAMGEDGAAAKMRDRARVARAPSN